MDEYVPMELIETTVGSGAIKQLQVKKGKTHQVYSQLHDHNPIPNVHVYYTTPKSGNLPDHYHFKKSDIVADLVLLADPGYAVVTVSNLLIKSLYDVFLFRKTRKNNFQNQNCKK